MQLNKLILNNFRNYKYQEIDLINGINFFEGNNAQGKTNIIESIYMCAFGKSYRTTKDIEVLKFNEEFCRITLTYKKKDIESNIEVYIDKNNKKQLKNFPTCAFTAARNSYSSDGDLTPMMSLATIANRQRLRV